MVTASHNPMDYNGMKLVGQDARPIGGDTGLRDIKVLVKAGVFPSSGGQRRSAWTHTSR